MLPMKTTSSREVALDEFRTAMQHAFWITLINRLRRKPTQLLDFEDARALLNLRDHHSIGLQDVPLNSIVGSVGRSNDFTRSFLPKYQGMRDRWSRVYELMTTVEGLDPVELYKICDSYFVVDGNHRVSVAYQFHAQSIEARVVEWESPVCLSPDTVPADLEKT